MIAHPAPLLRPPVELTAALVFIAVATIFLMFPQQLNLSWTQGIALSAGCAVLSIRRLFQALRVWRYRRHLSHRPPYVIKEIPNDQKLISKGLFVGRGFQWSQPHVQRLKETRTPAALKYLGKAGDQGGDPVLHGVGLLEGEQDVWMSLSERFGHVLILGRHPSRQNARSGSFDRAGYPPRRRGHRFGSKRRPGSVKTCLPRSREIR